VTTWHRQGPDERGTARRAHRTSLRTWMLIATCLLISLAAGCGDDDEASSNGSGQGSTQDQEFTIGAVVVPCDFQGWVPTCKGLKAAADENSVDLRIFGSIDAEEQVSVAEDYITQGVDLLIVSAIDGAAMSVAVERANEADIPVLSLVAGVESGDVATHVSPSYTEMGTAIGEAIVDWCADKDPCNLAVIQGNPADEAGREEYLAAKAVWETAPNVKLVSDQPGNWDDAQALDVATNALGANPDIDYIYAEWDSGALAALEAVRAAGLEDKDIGISGFAGSCEFIREMLAGNVTQTIAPSFREIGELTIDQALGVLNGENVSAETKGPWFSITSEEVQRIAANPEADADPFVVSKVEEAQADCKNAEF
jgi:ribose transport system substrate-binding protein